MLCWLGKTHRLLVVLKSCDTSKQVSTNDNFQKYQMLNSIVLEIVSGLLSTKIRLAVVLIAYQLSVLMTYVIVKRMNIRSKFNTLKQLFILTVLASVVATIDTNKPT